MSTTTEREPFTEEHVIYEVGLQLFAAKEGQKVAKGPEQLAAYAHAEFVLRYVARQLGILGPVEKAAELHTANRARRLADEAAKAAKEAGDA